MYALFWIILNFSMAYSGISCESAPFWIVQAIMLVGWALKEKNKE